MSETFQDADQSERGGQACNACAFCTLRRIGQIVGQAVGSVTDMQPRIAATAPTRCDTWRQSDQPDWAAAERDCRPLSLRRCRDKLKACRI
jgi:hypothetical protein